MLRMRHILAGMLLAATMSALADDAKPASTTRHDLVGAWRLIRIEVAGPHGSEPDPFYGMGSKGVLIYDDSGWFSVQIMGSHRPAVAVPASRPDHADPARQAAKAEALDSYYAYYGTWTFDPATSTVTHHARGALYPSERDAVYPQHVEVHGKTMTFTRTQGQGDAKTTQSKIWERAVSP